MSTRVRMSSKALFIAPLHVVDAIMFEESLRSYQVVNVEYSRNKNSATIEFSSVEEAKIAQYKLCSAFPSLNISEGKVKKCPQIVEIPMPLCGSDISNTLPGLVIIPEYISETDEELVVSELDAREWDTTIKRRVQHYGFRFEYSRLDVNKQASPTDFPPRCKHIVERPELVQFGFNQLTVNEYLAGIGIASHCDTHSAFTDCIAVVSLVSDITMDFISHDSTKKVHVVIPRRSLMLMTGEARYGWRHGIASRKSDRNPQTGLLEERQRRVSLTFRNCTKKMCECPFHSLCDTQGADLVRPRRMQNG